MFKVDGREAARVWRTPTKIDFPAVYHKVTKLLHSMVARKLSTGSGFQITGKQLASAQNGGPDYIEWALLLACQTTYFQSCSENNNKDDSTVS